MESHSHSLVGALKKAGHEVVLFAAGQSDLSCFTSICDRPYEDVLPWADWRGTERLAQYQQRAFTTAWNVIVQSDFDVVHNNSLYPDLIDWARHDDVPMLTSQHVPPYAMMRDAVGKAASSNSQQFSVTSNSQLRLWNPPGRTPHPNMRIVYNGVDLSSWQPAKKRSDRMLWFGRITPNKGLREAVAAALRAGIAMDIVGVIEDERYFAEHVQPHLSDQIAYRGHMTGEALRKAVCHARAVVVTPMWDEPFGLVAAEAMACDIPVIAFDRGAMSEVLGDCGTLVPAGDVEALAHAMACLDPGRQSGNRARALGFFSLEAMVAGYQSAYAAAIAGVASASSSSRTEALLA